MREKERHENIRRCHGHRLKKKKKKRERNYSEYLIFKGNFVVGFFVVGNNFKWWDSQF